MQRQSHRRKAAWVAVVAVTLSFAFATVPPIQRSAYAQPKACSTAGYFPFLCRGPVNVFDYSGENSMSVITFFSNAVAAGGNGSALAKGTCAWVNRPLNKSEPRQIMRQYSSPSGDDVRTYMLIQCSMNQNCVFEACVTNNGAGFLVMQTGPNTPGFDFATTFPTF